MVLIKIMDNSTQVLSIVQRNMGRYEASERDVFNGFDDEQTNFSIPACCILSVFHLDQVSFSSIFH